MFEEIPLLVGNDSSKPELSLDSSSEQQHFSAYLFERKWSIQENQIERPLALLFLLFMIHILPSKIKELPGSV